MRKVFSALLVALIFSISSSCAEEFKNIPSEYCISFGNPQAEIKVVEYFSLSCSKCIALLKRDFPHFREKYIDTEEVFWVLHPDPADILTLQLMECLEKLSEKEKRTFFEYLLETLPKRPSKKTVLKMQQVLEEWGRPLPYLHDLSFLEKTKSFQVAFAYVKQDDAPKEIPTISINGHLKEDFPTFSFVEEEIEKALKNSTNPQQKGLM
jgi:hypothetical protein